MRQIMDQRFGVLLTIRDPSIQYLLIRSCWQTHHNPLRAAPWTTHSSSEGWESVEFVGTTMDLEASLQQHLEEMENGKVANVRALSFAIPSRAGMDDWMKKWRNLALEAGGMAVKPEDYLVEEDEDDDDDDWDPEMLAVASAVAVDVVSPFDPSSSPKNVKAAKNEELPLTVENVDKVLNEVRPYLIADGGNVAVERVEPERGAVYLKLEGACGKHDHVMTRNAVVSSVDMAILSTSLAEFSFVYVSERILLVLNGYHVHGDRTCFEGKLCWFQRGHRSDRPCTGRTNATYNERRTGRVRSSLPRHCSHGKCVKDYRCRF
jgi:hypothetical protein